MEKEKGNIRCLEGVIEKEKSEVKNLKATLEKERRSPGLDEMKVNDSTPIWLLLIVRFQNNELIQMNQNRARGPFSAPNQQFCGAVYSEVTDQVSGVCFKQPQLIYSVAEYEQQYKLYATMQSNQN